MTVALRRYTLDDAAVAAEAVRESMDALQPWMPWCHATYSVDDARAWLEIQVPGYDLGTAYEFAIVAAADGRYLGGCGLNGIDRANRRANLGYWVRSGATRQGVATSAVRAIRDWAFDTTELIRLEILIAAGNVASHRVAEKAGALREATLRRRLVLHGEAHDATMFSMTRAMPA